MKCNFCEKINNQTDLYCAFCGKPLNTKNPNKIQEWILIIVNSVFILPFIYIPIFGLKLFEEIIEGAASADGSELDIDFLFGLDVSIDFFPQIIIASIILLLVNIGMGIIMNKRNKNTNYVGKYKMIDKTLYLSLVSSFGVIAMHRFVIGDFKGGLIRLLMIFIFPIFFLILLLFTSLPIFLILLIFSVAIGFGLYSSDLVIGLSKVSNQNHMISI